MKTLALELSSARGSIAFVAAEAVQFTAEVANDRKHSGAFFEQLQLCLRDCGSPHRIVVGLGPGSYAGTRIAIAAATGLQVVLSIPLLGISSLCAMPTDAAEYMVIGDARRGSFYFARIVERQLVDGPTLCTEAELHARIRGDVPVFSTESIAGATLMNPAAAILARLAVSTEAQLPLEPMYLREPHITVAKPVPFSVAR